MLQKLFSSRVRVELLSLFFLHAGRDFYLREIARLTGEDYKSVSMEAESLEAIGLLSSRREGNLKYFKLNHDFPLHNELRSIFLKARGASQTLREVLQPVGGIELAFIYGSFASGTETGKSDIDLMVIGAAALEEILKRIREPEETLGREINVSLFESAEIKQRLGNGDPFISRVLSEPKTMLIGDENDLRRLAEQRTD